MFAGVRSLIGLILRRDRVKLPIWIIGIVAVFLLMIPLLREVYGSEQDLLALFQTFGSNPAGLFLTGPMDSPTLGSLMTIETLLWWGLAIAFMNTLLVVRHTRQNEEIGAQELILSGQVHRSASLVAVLLVALLVNGLIAVGLGAGMAAIESSWSASQSWLYGLMIGLFGLAWAAIAALVAQLVESTRSANGILAGLIGASFVVRGVGDFLAKPDSQGLLQPAWVSWLSPFGWMQASRPLTYPEWWPILIPISFVVVAIPVTFLLLSRRDVGSGILPARRGRARASASLQTSIGLTWYLQKNVFIGWLIGVLVLMVTIGVLVPQMTEVYDSSAEMKNMIVAMGGAGAMIPAFLSAMLSFAVLMVLAYVVHGLGKLRSEEASGQLENLLATNLSRLKWLSQHVAMVVIASAIMLALAGALLAICVNMASDHTVHTLDYVAAALSYLPMILAFAGAYVLLFGTLPRLAGLVLWLYYGFVAFISWLGPLLALDQKLMNLSLLTHLAAAPAQAVAVEPLVIMTTVGGALLVIGSRLYRNRNLVER